MVSLRGLLSEAPVAGVLAILRSLVRAPGLFAAVIGTLILGIGTAGLVFALTGWLTLKRLPFPEPGRLVTVGMRNSRADVSDGLFGFQYEAVKQRTDVLSTCGAFRWEDNNVVVGGEPVPSAVLEVTSGYFSTQGVIPALGRLFAASEYGRDPGGVVVISDLFWHRHYGGDPSVLGKTITVGKDPCVVVGVLRADQLLIRSGRADVFRARDFAYDPTQPYDLWINIVARLMPGVSIRQARDVLAAHVAAPPKGIWPTIGLDPVLAPVSDLYKAGAYWLMLAAGVFLYLIAALNAANLMLVRASGRSREWSIRFAIGASRWQVIRPVVAEALILGGTAGAVVIVLARFAFPALVVLIARSQDTAYDSFWDPATLLFIAVSTAVSVAAIAALPVARLLRQDIRHCLSEGSAGAGESAGARRARGALVVIQAALAVILLAGAGLMVQTFQRLVHMNLGFDPHHAAEVFISRQPFDPKAPQQRRQFFEKLCERILHVPGVADVSYGSETLLTGKFYATDQVLETSDATPLPVNADFVSGDFAKTAGLHVLGGSWIDDKQPATMTCAINTTLARLRFGTRDPVGQYVKVGTTERNWSFRVVGVVADVRESPRVASGNHMYIPEGLSPGLLSMLMVRLNREPDALFESQIRRIVYQADSTVVANIRSVDEAVGNMAFMERYVSTVLAGLSAIALVLAATGLFSALACSVDRRMPEFGVRLALGATPARIIRQVIYLGLALAALGVALGAACALGLTRFLGSLLFDTAPYDPLIYLGAAALLVGVAAVACWLPARRASSADVLKLLKAE